MFKQNIGNTERIVRVLVGAALIAGYFVSEGAYSWLYLLGIIPLVTGALGYCPPYAWFGINTCKRG